MSLAAEIVGALAGALTTVAFVPQVVKVLRTRRVEDISLGMYSVFVTGIVFWWIYGLLIRSWPILIANSITLLLAGTVLGMKIWIGRKPRR